MAFSATTIHQPQSQPAAPTTKIDTASALLASLLMTMYAGKASAKQLRKLKRKFAWEAMKLKAKSFLHNPFKPAPAPGSISDRTLIYILIGLLVIILLFVSPIAAIAVLLLGILLILLLKF